MNLLRGSALGPPDGIPGVYPVEDTALQVHCAGIPGAKLGAAVSNRAVGHHDGPVGRALDPMAAFLKVLLGDCVNTDDRDGPLRVISAVYPYHGRLETVGGLRRDHRDVWEGRG